MIAVNSQLLGGSILLIHPGLDCLYHVLVGADAGSFCVFIYFILEVIFFTAFGNPYSDRFYR